MDALLIVSFGGPETRDEVMPFLEHVLKGRNVPHERMLEVAEHYYHFGGKSPLNDHTRALLAAVRSELAARSNTMPVFWGNRHAAPFVEATLRQMREAGVSRAFVFVTSAYSSYSGCRQYREALQAANAAMPTPLDLVILRRAFDHPRFVNGWSEQVATALAAMPERERAHARLVFTAHSIPESMSAQCDYVTQLRAVSDLVAKSVGHLEWDLVYQSRSGPPHMPWLAPDIGDHLRDLKGRGVDAVLIVPIGFLSDHMEVVWDLDEVANQIAAENGIFYARAATIGTHPEMVKLVVDLLEEPTHGAPRRTLNVLPPRPDVCAIDCCPAPRR